jgi:putative ABC transport system ATP-binding protein
MIRTSELTYAYSGGSDISFPAIDIEQGAHYLILGTSGSGKTTLLHLLSGLLAPKQGLVHVQDTEISRLSGSKLDAFRGKHIGVVFQVPHFIAALTVSENLQIAQKMPGNAVDKKRIESVLTQLNLGHKLHALPSNLSQGEKQRVSIARAIINKPAVIFADEPTAALDDKNTKEVTRILKETALENNATLIIVTHDNRLKTAFKNKIILGEI